MSSKRCQYIVTDPYNHKTRKCKNNHKWQINDLKCCTLHYIYIYKKNAIIIQCIFRGNKCRKKMKYFRILDPDTKNIIVTHMRKEYYDYKYNKSVANVILKKIDNFIKKNIMLKKLSLYISIVIELYSGNTESRNINLKNTCHELFHIYGLLDKYYDLIKDESEFYKIQYIDQLYIVIDYPLDSMFTKLNYVSKKIIYNSQPQTNLESLSRFDNFLTNLPYIISFNEKYKINNKD